MGRGNLQIAKRRCAQCGTFTKAERNSIEWGAGDLLLLFMTVLIWLPIKYGWNALVNPWRCATCGTKV